MPMMLNSTSIKSFVMRLMASPLRASEYHAMGNFSTFTYIAFRKSRLTPVRIVASENNAVYPTAFFKMVTNTMPKQMYSRAASVPTDCTKASNWPLNRSIPPTSAGNSTAASAASPPNRILRNGTTLRNVKRDKNAFRMLQMMFTAKLALYGNTYPINSRNRFKSMVLQSVHQLGRQPNVITGG